MRTKGRDTPDDLYTSKEFGRINKKVDGKLDDKDNSAWDIGMDFGQVFVFRTWSVGIIGIR